jgi:hypothetical protein
MSNSGLNRLARRYAPKQVLMLAPFQRGGSRGAARDPVEILDSGVLVPEVALSGSPGPLLAAAAAAQKVKLTPSPGAPEARQFGPGTELLAVSIPVAFPGSLVETIDLDDLKQLIDLVLAVLGG